MTSKIIAFLCVFFAMGLVNATTLPQEKLNDGQIPAVFKNPPNFDIRPQFCQHLDRLQYAPDLLSRPVLEVNRILILKKQRKALLLNSQKVLRSYNIGLGFNPVGAKTQDNDGRTPEGVYYIAFKNPHSAYHLSLMISYPNEVDAANALISGVKAGKEIFLHGLPTNPLQRYWVKNYSPRDWTRGCIAFSDADIEEVFAYVQEGTAIEICP